MQVNLTPNEARQICAAMYAVSPSGGGSPQFHLANKLTAALNVKVDDAFQQLVGHYQSRAYDEVMELING